jgi:hypothetical protein
MRLRISLTSEQREQAGKRALLDTVAEGWRPKQFGGELRLEGRAPGGLKKSAEHVTTKTK